MKNFLTIFLIICGLFILSQQLKQDGTKCKVLALNDGDDLMVYEAAAIKGLFDNLPTEEADYDVITGQSFSAISAVFLATYPKGQEKQAAADLLSIWKQVEYDDIYDTFLGGIVQAILFESSIYKTNALKYFLTNLFSGRTLKRQVFFGSIDANTLDYIQYNNSVTGNNLVDALMASTAIPVNFPYQVLDGRILFSGSLAHAMEIASGINYCKELGFDDVNIQVRGIFTFDEKLQEWEGTHHTIQAYTRWQTMVTTVRGYRDYVESCEAFPLVYFLHPIYPRVELPDNNQPFVFAKGDIAKIEAQGYAEGTQAAVNPEPPEDTCMLSEKVVSIHKKKLIKAGIEPTEENLQNFRKTILNRRNAYQKLNAELQSMGY